jgi:hypothetical protein
MSDVKVVVITPAQFEEFTGTPVPADMEPRGCIIIDPSRNRFVLRGVVARHSQGIGYVNIPLSEWYHTAYDSLI